MLLDFNDRYECHSFLDRITPIHTNMTITNRVYKFKKIRGMTDFSDQFRKIIMRYKRIGYNLNVM